MPTLARRERGKQLLRALESATGQEGVRAVPLVVVNGPLYDPELAEALRRRRDVRLFFLEQPGLPAALRFGRLQVDSPWFGELDDDDELLPGALAARVAALVERPDYDVAVSNGYLREGDEQWLNIADLSSVAADPLRALLRRQWLSPCAGLYRSAAVGVEVFEGMPPYLEWTYLALRLSLRFKIWFLNQPGFIYHRNLPGSLWTSLDCTLGRPAALERMLELELPADVRAALRWKLAEACHCAADDLRREGRLGEAWRWHLRSLRAGGWRYLPLAWHLTAALWRRPGGQR